MQASNTSRNGKETRAARAIWRCTGALSLAMVIVSCGGGGSGGGSALPTVATLEVTPTTATIPVGGTAQYTVVARDGTGLVVATPPVVWASSAPAVGSITAAGLATGESLGQTPITATAGSVVSPQTMLNVVDSACAGVAAVRGWQINLWYAYHDSITTPANGDVTAGHVSSVASTLTAASGGGSGILMWTGQLASAPGAVYNGIQYRSETVLNEELNDLISDPTDVIVVDGAGSPLPTPGVDGFTLKVDLATCTFQFTAAPSVHTTITRTVHAVNTLPGSDEGTHVTEQDFPLGLLRKGTTPLGDWRTMGMGGYPNQFEFTVSYFIGSFPENSDGYMPSGMFPQGVFFNPPSTTTRGTGTGPSPGDVTYSYKIVPLF